MKRRKSIQQLEREIAQMKRKNAEESRYDKLRREHKELSSGRQGGFVGGLRKAGKFIANEGAKARKNPLLKNIAKNGNKTFIGGGVGFNPKW
jgi:hypothetical protein